MNDDAEHRSGRSGRRVVVWWLPTALWAAIIFLLSSKSIRHRPSWWFPHADKVIHAGLFGTLSFLVFLAFRRGHELGRRAAAILAVTVAVGYGAVDEIHQRFVPHRSSDLRDLAADAAGAVAAAALAAALDAALRRRP
jgi:VanZ family protein